MRTAYYMTMKELPARDRPYEKLELEGARALSDSELLAIILKSGTKNRSALSVAREIISLSPRGLSGLQVLSCKDLQSVNGVGKVKAVQLKALAEISKRMSKSEAVVHFRIESPKSIAMIYMEELRYLKKERIVALFLDNRNGIICEKVISIGTVNASLIAPREILIEALKAGGVQFFLLHNHPSGDPNPSQEDLMISRRLVEAGKIVGIPLLDHIIIGDGTYYSMKEQEAIQFI